MLLPFLLVLLGFAALIGGANWMVDGASSLARRYGVSDLAIGLTVGAFGTSAPELVVFLGFLYYVFTQMKNEEGLHMTAARKPLRTMWRLIIFGLAVLTGIKSQSSSKQGPPGKPAYHYPAIPYLEYDQSGYSLTT